MTNDFLREPSDSLIDSLPRGARVCIIRLRALGDCVLSTPAIRLLKQHRPDLEISVVTDPGLADIYAGNPDVAVPLPPSIQAVRAFRPDLCLNFHGGTRSARLTLFSGAPHRAGYDMLRFQTVYNLHIPTAQQILGIERAVHTAEHMASAMFYLGVPIQNVPGACLFPRPGRSELAPGGPYAILHTAASRPDKMWPAERFCSLAQALDLEPVFIGGGSDDLSPFGDWRVIAGAPLKEIARVLRDASLFIGNDSGPAHMAAALGTPSVILFGPSDEAIWGPWRAPGQVLKAAGPMSSITVEEVLRAAKQARS